MAIVTSLTDEAILSLAADWQGTRDQQSIQSLIVSQLATDLDDNKATLLDFTQNTLPQLEATLASNADTVAMLNGTTLPDLDLRLESAASALENLTSVSLPGLQSVLDGNLEQVTSLNETVLPDLVTRLESAEAAVAAVDTTALQGQLDAAAQSIVTLTGTTIPDLQNQISTNHDDISVVISAIPGLQSSLDANTSSLATLNSTTLPDLGTRLSGAETDVTSLQGKFPVVANDLAANAVTANKIAANAVTTNAIAAGAITAAKIAADTITANEIAANAVTASELKAGEIVSTHISTTGLDAAVIKFGTMSGSRITVNTLSGDRITASSIASSSLLITDLSNVIENPQARVGAVGTNPSGWTKTVNLGPTIVTDTLPDGSSGPVFEITANGAIQDAVNREIDVSPGDQFWVSGYVKKVSGTDTTGTVQVLANTTTKTDGSSDFTSATAVNISTLTAGVWVAYTGTVTMPALAYKTKWRMSVRNDIADGVYHFWGLQARRRNTGALIVDGTITAAKIATDTITANEIAAGAITASEIATDAVTATKILAGSITTAKIAAGAVTATEIAADAVTASKILAGSITTIKMAADAITANELAADAVTASKILAGSITTAKIAAGAVTANEIAAGAITTAKLAAGAVTANEIAAGSITAVELAAEAVTADKIKVGSLTGAQLSADVILSNTRIAAVGGAGQSVELNPSGFYVYGPTSESNPAYISFPTEGGTAGKPNIISGTLEATTLTVLGDSVTGKAATFRNTSNIEVGATILLNDAVLPPQAAPATENARVEDNFGPSLAIEVAGASWNPTDSKVYIGARTGYKPSTGVWQTYQVYTYSPSTKTYATLLASGLSWNNRQLKGFQRIGTSFYALFQATDGSLYLNLLDPTTFVTLTSISLGTPATSIGQVTAALGSDGTDPWVAVPDLGSSNVSAVRFKRYLANLSSTSPAETITSGVSIGKYSYGADLVSSLVVGNMDFGARKFALGRGSVSTSGGYTYDSLICSTTGSRETVNDFVPMRQDDPQLLMWRGTSPSDATGYFIDITSYNTGSGGKVMRYHQYSGIKANGSFQNMYFNSTFFKAGTPDSETLSSKESVLLFNSRWFPKITVGGAPSGLTSRIYGGSFAAGTTYSRLQETLATGIVSTTLSSILTATAPPTVSSFGATTPASIQSLKTITRIHTVGITNGSTTVTGIDFNAAYVGKSVSGTGIPAGAVVTAVSSSTSLTISLAATATNAALVMTLTLPKLEIRGDGYARISELDRVIISSTRDVDATSGNDPALRIGNIAGQHLRMDGNEIQSMSGDSTTGQLIFQQSGGLINFQGADQIYAGNLIKSGTKSSGTITANTVKTVTVTFSTPFPSTAPVPVVTTGLNVASPASGPAVGVDNVTRSGFNMNFYRTTATAFDAFWVAVAHNGNN